MTDQKKNETGDETEAISQEGQAGTPVNKKKRSLLRRFFRGFLFVFLFLLFVFLCFDFYCERYGVPEFVLRPIRNALLEHGIEFSAGQIRSGIIGGIHIDDFHIYGLNDYEYLSLHAEEVNVFFKPMKVFQKTFLPFHFVITNGKLDIPVFPEYGKESSDDIISVTHLNADIIGEPGLIRVNHFEGRVYDFSFSGQGTFDNILHAIGAKGGVVIQKTLSDTEDEIDMEDDSYQKFPFFSRTLVDLPLKFRRNLIFAVDRLQRESFENGPSARIDFDIDVNNFKKNKIKAEISLPAFQYDLLKVGSLDEVITLENGVICFESFTLMLSDSEYISGYGEYDAARSTLSGTVKGECTPEKILLFVDERSRKSIFDKVQFKENSHIVFSGSVDNFSFRNIEQIGNLELFIPEVNINRMELKDISLSLSVRDNDFSGEILSADIIDGTNLSGTFTIQGNSFSCDVAGAAAPDRLKYFLSEKAEKLISDHITFSEEEPRIAFKGRLWSGDWSKLAFSGAMELLLPAVKWHGLEIESCGMDFEFSPDLLRAKNLEAVLDANTKFSGSLSCFLEEDMISASLVSAGSPEKAIRMLDPGHKTFIESLMRNITWPQGDNLVELTADVVLQMEPELIYFLTGSIVMTDFKYRDIPFRYGATRYLIDSNKTLILPGATLETEDGNAVISVRYDASEKAHVISSAESDQGTVPKKQNGDSIAESEEKELPSGRLDFTLQSSMAGNDILRCLYPEWKSDIIDFPNRINVRAQGVIDYMNEEETDFSADITNSSLIWNNIEVRDIDANVKYANYQLSFDRGSAEVAKGRLTLDYHFDYYNNAGNIHLELSESDLLAALEELGCKGIAAGEENKGVVSATIDSFVKFGENDKLEMYGEGTMKITGTDLWTIPLFGDLLKFLGYAWSTVENFGTITNINCSFILEKDKLITEKLKSDGGIIALDAKGEYNFQENEFDIRFRAELLKSLLPFEALSRILFPLSWFFERRLSGKFSDYEWN